MHVNKPVPQYMLFQPLKKAAMASFASDYEKQENQAIA
jgi:hypothetical protein